MIIAIDGPSGAGKGTVAQYLAQRYNLKKLDTGLLYRALAAKIIERGVNHHDEVAVTLLADKITIEDTQRGDLKTEAVAAIASKIASYPPVRTVLSQLQRDFANGEYNDYAGVILDGRDIGTVICPHATVKIYLTASQETRALRRMKEEGSVSHLTIQRMMEERDQRDSTRPSAPLSIADDAIVIDTTNLTIDEVCEKAAYYIENFDLPALRRQA